MLFRWICDECGSEYVFEKPCWLDAKIFAKNCKVCVTGQHVFKDDKNMYEHAAYFGQTHAEVVPSYEIGVDYYNVNKAK